MRLTLFITFLLLASLAFSQTDTTAVDTNKIYLFVDQMPQYEAGEAAMMQQMRKITNNCAEDDLSSKVIVSFVVERDGSVSDLRIKKSMCGGVDRQMLALVKEFKFTPGKMSGVPVRVAYNLPLQMCKR